LHKLKFQRSHQRQSRGTAKTFIACAAVREFPSRATLDLLVEPVQSFSAIFDSRSSRGNINQQPTDRLKILGGNQRMLIGMLYEYWLGYCKLYHLQPRSAED
jgi:hypothetical protein